MAIPITAALQAGLGIAQSIGGLIGQNKAKNEMERLQAQRKAFQTPEEVFQILQATQANAQQGLGAQTLNYLTGQADTAFSSGIGALALAGGSANDFGSLFEQSLQNSMQIAGQDQAARMANFSKYLGALNTVAANREAEQISADNLLKDRMQATAANSANATKSLQSGVNATIGAVAAFEQSNLYNQQQGNNARALGNLDFLNQGIVPVPSANIYRTSDVYLGTPNNTNPYLT